MPTQSFYSSTPVPPEQFPDLSRKLFFAGIDLAPNDTLETGITVLDRARHMLRMDKLNTDKEIIRFLQSLGPAENTLIAIDVPKSLSIPSRWRQEEIKMHPLRLVRQNGEGTDRFSKRTWDLCDTLQESGFTVVFFYSYEAKVRYDLSIPFRTRTPQGCRALQLAIKTSLSLENMPTNLAPSSVLDSMIGAYTAWLLYQGADGKHFNLYADANSRYYLEPLKRIDDGR